MKKIAFNNKTGFGGNLYAICTIVPNVYYSEGIEKDVFDVMFFDKYNPEFANENFVDIPRYCLSAISDYSTDSTNGGDATITHTPIGSHNFASSLGRTTSWWNYQTDVNRSFSLLSKGQSMEGWLLNRTTVMDNKFHYSSGGLSDPAHDKATYKFFNSSYCFPHQFNYCFADTDPTAQNFIVQFAADINVRRVMPSYNQPKIF